MSLRLGYDEEIELASAELVHKQNQRGLKGGKDVVEDFPVFYGLMSLPAVALLQ